MNNFDSVRVGCLAPTVRRAQRHSILRSLIRSWSGCHLKRRFTRKNISRDPRVSFTMWKSPTIALRIDGIARVASGDEALALTRTFHKKLGDSPKLPGAFVYAVDRVK